MRNDKKGETTTQSGARVVYASGERGPERRADGRGGYLARGYYRFQGQDRKGPFSCRENANW